MKLQDALEQIYAPKGATSIVTAALTGDFSAVRDQDAAGVTLEQARRELERWRNAMENAQSDAAYWGYMGDVAYWRCVVNLLEAAKLVGADNLPDVPLPNMNGVLMDVQGKLAKWGKDVLLAAKKQAENR